MRGVVLGVAATAILLTGSALAYQPTRNFASCNPPGHVHIPAGRVYICPRRYLHYWTVHLHSGVAAVLLIAAVAVALATGAALVARRRTPLATQ
jgi:hypothetical protein